MTALQFRALLGQGVVAQYGRLPGGGWSYEGPRPGPEWHRHDWKVRELVIADATGVERRQVARRRWRLRGETTTQLDRSPDEVGRLSAVLLTVLAKLWSWLSSDQGVQLYEEIDPALASFGCPRTVHRWSARFVGDAMQLEQALRTAVIERFEPQPIEKLFPGGLSPPGAVRRRRWKGPTAMYSLGAGLAFLFDGAKALATSTPVLLAEAHRRLNGPLGMTVA